ncbi:50S ribosomal protein L9 [Candidatus Aminicenantes bacterium AC-335-B20]|jgi:large subunit ribosomal protein L9|nr:50S ribosomal protein L9 [SCandidatus Aminicenantes bacterium Aminicenantia_JdfR_composite]MCP2596679.1 50S ribosomal protein L9 [Candidatus Aminicenantes bacterium AC-335-G13]MCP2598923.1 50S ribosomal protein L9 [Candidatus Aminicenantes bacterium AC-335-B20]
MKVILKEDVPNLGRKGDIVEVAPGYGRNYLIPKKMAIEVTPSNLKMIEIERKAILKRIEKEKLSAEELAKRLSEVKLTFYKKAGEKDVIFGSVTSHDIQEALEKLGYKIDKKKIVIEEPIKRLGNYSVPIKIYHDIIAEINIEVLREEEKGAEEEKKTKEGKKTKEEKKEK